MIALVFFLPVARDRTVDVACIVPRMGANGRVVLVPMQSGARHKLDENSFLKTFCGECFDPVASLIAFSLSFEVDLAWVEPVQRWYRHQFSWG